MKRKKTICARVVGGIGNQLFIYAFARALELRFKWNVLYDLKTGFSADTYGRSPKLSIYIDSMSVATTRLHCFFYFTKLLSSISRILFKAVIVEEPNNCVLMDIAVLENSKENLIFIQGYFQSYMYFRDFAEQICRDIKFKVEKTNLIENLLTKISDSMSVSIHVRRMQYTNLLKLEYYLTAIESIKSWVSNPVFFVFSDDMEWCKENFSNLDNFIFVLHDIDDEIADLWLMSQCKHHIIANSSFSWWGAWLSKADDNKRVYAPTNTQIGVQNLFYPQDWTVI